jgi:hypothetical protein
MKKAITILIVLCISLSIVSMVSADSAVPGGPFASSMTVQNLGTAIANVNIQYVDATGTTVVTSTHTIAVNDVLFIYVPNQAGLAAGQYSVIISSDQPVAAVSNFADGDSGASYSGLETGAPVWYFPAVYDNYYSYFAEVLVQNVSPAALAVTIDVFAPGNATPVYSTSKNAPSNATISFSLQGLTQLADNVPYSAKISSTGNVVAISNLWGSGTTAPQLYSYDGFSSGARVFYVPSAAKNYYGWNSSVNIQNISATAATVTVTYSTGYGTTYSIPSNSGKAIYVPGEVALPTGLHSVKVESDQDIVVTVNQSNNYNRAATYNGAPSGTATVALPNAMKRYYFYSSSISCQNIGAASTTMTATFTNNPAATKTSPSIPAGGSWLIYLPNETALPVGFNGSATVTSSGEPIICIANSNMEDAPQSTENRDELKIYNGANR